MRMIWALPEISQDDKIETVFKTGIYDCVKFLIEETDWVNQIAPYLAICCAKGHERSICLLLSNVEPAANEPTEMHKLFITVVVLLIKGGHLDLALLFFKNERGVWPSRYFSMFNGNDRYHCWKVAVQAGHFELEEHMAKVFVTDEEQRGRLPATRLLVAIESYNIAVFDAYWKRMEDDREGRRAIAMHAHLELVIHGMNGAPNRAKREAMANHVGRCLSLDPN